ncbi:MAG: molybdopterin-dependent oxidoreductase [Alphaproteobacteria bacterium]|nr:molybdopterin-dependent oxidoreductase [Alphaproteobacteria bacterium]
MTEQQRVPAFCTQCRSRCGCEVLVEDGAIVGIEPQPSHPSGKTLCPKGKAVTELVYHKDRLTQPLRRTSPKGAKVPTWEPISWDEALTEIAGHMGRIRDDHGAEQIAFSVTTPSGTHMSDCISWVERFIRAYGSPNTIYGTEICNWHKDIASKFTYGSDIGTPDFANTDCVLLWGHNPAATWLARSIEVQKAMRRGVKMIVVDPRPTLYAKRADCWLKVRPGTDQALALGITNLLLSSGRFDVAFVREWTNATFLVRDDTGTLLRESDLQPDGDKNTVMAAGAKDKTLLAFDTAQGRWQGDCANAALMVRRRVSSATGEIPCRTALQVFAEAAAEYPPARVAEITGVPEEKLQQAADILAESASVAYYAWNGVGQSATATQTDRAISILYGLTGSYGRAGGNVPGGAARFNDIAGHDLLTDTQRAKALGLDTRPIGPGKLGWVTARDVYDAVLTQKPYPVRALISFGGNLLAAQPDPAKAKEAFDKLEFHVHTDFFLNATAEYADIVLPVSTSWEREGLRPGFDVSLEGLRKVQLRLAIIAPIGESRSDTDIVLDLAQRLGLSDVMFDCDADKGHAHILTPSGVDLETLKANPEGITLPGSVKLSAYLESGFATPTKRLEIYSEQLMKSGYDPVPALDTAKLPNNTNPAYPLRLGSAKTITYCHSQGRNIASLRRLTPDPVLELSLETADASGIALHDWVEISTKAGRCIARAKPTKDLAPDAVFAQHGWAVSTSDDAPNPGGDRLATNLNQAISTEHTDPISGSIPLRCSWCNIRKL